ncbi:MAG: GTP cyclohydrolase II [Gammaproteobacteria bacterium]|nr:GTP cyclohydrolase II [Gammaproteobacteria bacterium]NNF50764.1 GTP cyclohydrolase II [Woeseiaceae bacterium]MBT8094391.1 GTP cyclohydrolase II [Gammaproteobacteria bacterium]MBT8104973.1 GTP cyclohydrolase II [Gammaproteobacteria bacterium]NNK24987.1 GTP cyclohydrolase II [Woeseiaceae bacterium]
MFTYIDPTVRERLTEKGTLFQIDRDGVLLEPGRAASPGGHTISILGPIPLPLALCDSRFEVQWFACVRNTELGKIEELADDLRAQDAHRSFATLASYMAVNSVMVIGDPSAWSNPLVRVHSSCLTGDVFGSQRCECGPQMHTALERIAGDDQGGLLVYMAGHEGRGIGLWAKAATYLLQDAGENTYQANESLGLPADSRDFGDAASLLKYFVGGQPFRLLTNNPKKVNDLGEHGVTGITRVKHLTGVSASNRRYLSAKQEWGHEIEPEDID